MELSDLHVFRTVVNAGGVTRAADRLHRVQSNVTARVKKLEEELGVALFLREGKRLQLSSAGKTLLEYADRLLALADEARDALQDAKPRGVLRLGSMESTAAARLPGPLSAFHERYPEVSVELHIGTPRELIAQVLAGTLDAALVADAVSDPRLESVVAFEEELVVVTAAGHPPIGTPRDVQKRTLLAFHPGCPHRKRLEDWFERYGVPAERVIEMASYHAILGCALAGMGIALLPRSVLDTYTERGRLSVSPLGGKFRTSQTYFAWRREAPQARIAALAELLLAGSPRRTRLAPRKSHARAMPGGALK
jgi:DNA-binding transcriptional LysR family regulator